MYPVVGSELCGNLNFSSYSTGALASFLRYNSHTHSITKKATKTAGMHIQLSTHINNDVHLVMYLGNVLFCRFSFLD